MATAEEPEVNVVCWNINGRTKRGDAANRRSILEYYKKKVLEGSEFVPDLIFLQEVPWKSPSGTTYKSNEVVGPLLQGTNYKFTKDSWVVEKGGVHTVILYSETKLIGCDYSGGEGDDPETGDRYDLRNKKSLQECMEKAYQALDGKKELAQKILKKYKNNKELSEAANTGCDEEAKEIRKEFTSRQDIQDFINCFKKPDSHSAKKAADVLEGRVAICAFRSRWKPDRQFTAVSFHNRSAHYKPVKLFHLLCDFLKEFHKLAPYPILLAGDFNMDVTETNFNPFKSIKYEQSKRRDEAGLTCVDNIVLWDDRGIFKLRRVKARTISESALQQAHSRMKKETITKLIPKAFDHDPLTTTMVVKKPNPQRVCKANFSVFSWNVQGTSDESKYKTTALKNELTNVQEQHLVFLQEVPVKDLLPKIRETPPPHNLILTHSEDDDDSSCNVIMYDNNKFSIIDSIYKKAHDRLQMKLFCIEAYEDKENFLVEIDKLKQKHREMSENITQWVNRISKDVSFRHEYQFLHHCFPEGLPVELDTDLSCVVLQTNTQPARLIITASLHITHRHPKRMLNAVHYLLKELREYLRISRGLNTVIPILLAGDFNMGVFRSDKEGTRICVYPLLPYNPQPYQPYEQSKHREQTYTDYIMLWDGSDVTWTLGEVHRYEICPKPFRDKETFPEFHHRPTHEILDAVSLHDPLTAELHQWKKPHKGEVYPHIYSM
jgi:endonuclease/exonuclease/phosphatase family metal-dependent hydrolase